MDALEVLRNFEEERFEFFLDTWTKRNKEYNWDDLGLGPDGALRIFNYYYLAKFSRLDAKSLTKHERNIYRNVIKVVLDEFKPEEYEIVQKACRTNPSETLKADYETLKKICLTYMSSPERREYEILVKQMESFVPEPEWKGTPPRKKDGGTTKIVRKESVPGA